MPGFTAADSRAPTAVLYRGLRVIKAGRPRLILDVGCGAGRESAALAEAVGARIVALDIDLESLRRAPRHPHVLYIRADAACLPVASAAAQAVYSFGLLSSLRATGYEAIRSVLAEMRRALPPDGVAIMSALADFRQDDDPFRSLTGAEVSQVLRGNFVLHELIGLRDAEAAGRQARYWYIHALASSQA